MTKEEATARVKHQRDWANEVNRMLDVEAFDMAIKALEQEPSKGSSYIQAIYTEALEEGIRCAMCTNTIKSDTGCDGGCIVDAKMYNKVMTEINSRLLRQPPVTPQEPNTWSLDDAREDFMHDVYNELDFLPTNEEANRIIDIFDRVTSSIEQAPRWIPVNEKLPRPYTFVNATCRSLVDNRENWVVETVYLPILKEVNEHGYSDWGNIPMLNWGEAEVIAWVERVIPQPYQGGQEDA